MVKCHVVDVHMIPLRESQPTYDYPLHASIHKYKRRIKIRLTITLNFWIQSVPYRIAHKLGFELLTLATYHIITTPQCIPLGPNMVKCHVVDVHMIPLREWQHTYHQNIEQISSSHDYLQHDFSRDLKNKSNYSQMINMFMIRGVLNIIMDLNI